MSGPMRQNAKHSLGAWAFLVGAVICAKAPHDLALGCPSSALCADRQEKIDVQLAGAATPNQVARCLCIQSPGAGDDDVALGEGETG